MSGLPIYQHPCHAVHEELAAECVLCFGEGGVSTQALWLLADQ